MVVGGEHLKLVVGPLGQAGNKKLPNAALEQFAHRVDAAVPVVKVAHDRDAPRVWRPDVKGASAHSVQSAQVRAKLFIKIPVLPFGKQVGVKLT